MIHSGKFNDKRVLIVDKEDKDKNDRTWSFWETAPGLFESIVYRRWKHTWFHSDNFSRLLHLAPYEYKMIRGLDFYDHCFRLIKQQSNFEIRKDDIRSVENVEGAAAIGLGSGKINADYIFNSIFFEKPVLNKKEYYLRQHFKGWIIETAKPAFKPGEATLMDFRVNQQQGATFVYVKPFSETSALIEYTLFSEALLPPAAYEEGLKKYIDRFITKEAYRIKEEEAGIIPMTNFKFPAVNGRIINIGTAGGQTKASSGYTFNFIQKHSARLVNSLIKKKNPFITNSTGSRRFRFYDGTLLSILKKQDPPGAEIFTRLFKKNKPQRVLRFLDNESSLIDELKIISSLPTVPFLKAALKQL